ncbi:MAG: hypothetical protein DHS20C21_03700 [Gemmatimonadota bacterium]|nr:MAG: hypothetical protein DHS20C21_03700 [Gemmatimonadota bacterium]
MIAVPPPLVLLAPLDLSAIPEILRGSWMIGVAFVVGGLLTAILLRRPGSPREPKGEIRPVVPSLRTRLIDLNAEVDRARRYERSVAVIVLKLDDATTVGASLGLVDPASGSGIVSEQARALIQSARQVMFWNVGYVLNDLLRASDVAACDLPEQRYVVLLPEAEEEEAMEAANRLESRIMDAAGVHVRLGVAVYRHHGLTIEHLMESAASMSDRMAHGPTRRRTPKPPSSGTHRLDQRATS